MTDEQLIADVYRGVPGAMTPLFTAYFQPLVAFLCKLGLDYATACDLAQQALSNAATANGPARFDATRGPFKTWLYRIARNLFYSHLRRTPPPVGLDDGCEPVEVFGPTTLPKLSPAKIAEIRIALKELPDSQRDAVVLCHMHDLSAAEAAGVMGCSVAMVYKLAHQGRTTLRQRLSP
jgi:RNA polymerase sigma-70 factor (ECF subfamily)